MSVVAGCSLFNGVMLASDCRLTVEGSNNTKTYSDNVQKIFPLTPTMGIGFVGSLGVAGHILQGCRRQIQRKSRIDTISMNQWLPRYFRHSFSKIKFKQPVAFMVASVIPRQPNIIERENAVKIMNKIIKEESPAKRNWIPDILVKIIRTPKDDKYVTLLDCPKGFLYVMKSPNFIPKHLKPLEFAAIGSGQNVNFAIEEYQDMIFAGDVGNSFFESINLKECMRRFIKEHNIEDVGGLYPCLKVGTNGIELLGNSVKSSFYNTEIKLSCNNDGRWIQKNVTSGKEIKLLFPWEIDCQRINRNNKFDDLDKIH